MCQLRLRHATENQGFEFMPASIAAHRFPGALHPNPHSGLIAVLPKKFISGGQTGVDRAALDFAIASQIAHGGWCPKGRRASDGVIPAKYHLQETESAGYRQRTKRNVLDSDATLVLNMGELEGGTLQTVKFAQGLKRPYRVIQLDGDGIGMADETTDWLASGQYRTLNIAGPREEKRAGIYALTLAFLESLATCADRRQT